MVLSNKKLKQKVRAAKAESLVSDGDIKESAANPESNSTLEGLLEASKQRQRSLKREKRRKALALQGLDGEKKKENKKAKENQRTEEENDEALVVSGGNEERKRKKKRKREEGESEAKGAVENGVAKEGKKPKKKKKNKKNNKGNNAEEEKKSFGSGGNTVSIKESIESEVNEEIRTKVYVGGIPYYSSEDDICSYFESYGTITAIDCMKFPDSGKFRGIAIISFKTEAAAKRALALDGADMGGFFLKIQPYKTTRAYKVSNFAPEVVKGYNRIYAGNLSWDITEDDLKKFFSDCHISSVRFGMDKETGEFRGYAHIDFSDNLSLMMALKLDQKILCGRPIKISCAVPKKGTKIDETDVPTEEAVKIHETDVPAGNEANSDVKSTSAISGKIKRRTCYECGEKGHISTACPKKKLADPTDDNTS